MIEFLLLISLISILLILFIILFEYHAIVFTFHSVSLKEDDIYTIRPKRIVSVIRLMLKLGYKPVSLPQLEKFQHLGIRDVRRVLLVTFDDGYSDNYHIITWLLHHRIPVLVFLTTNHINGINIWDNRTRPGAG